MQLEKLAIAELVEDPANARDHDDKNLNAIGGSLKRFKQQKPIVVDRNNVVVAGNGTLRQARLLGWTHIWAVRTELAGADAMAFAIADNRTAELASWNDGVLAKQLRLLDGEGWHLPSLGFDVDDLTKLFDQPPPPGGAPPPADAPTRRPEWLVVVECADENEQQSVYEALQAEGRKCKII